VSLACPVPKLEEIILSTQKIPERRGLTERLFLEKLYELIHFFRLPGPTGLGPYGRGIGHDDVLIFHLRLVLPRLDRKLSASFS